MTDFLLRLNTDSWISDTFQRTHSEEAKFFMPYDLEISNQELSRIVKRAEQWRGVLGERRTVSVVTWVCLWLVSSAEFSHQHIHDSYCHIYCTNLNAL